jgi:hypothetical protein
MLTLRDVLGRIVLTQTLVGEEATASLNGLEAGVYVAEIDGQRARVVVR